jgi:hypothetical protein
MAYPESLVGTFIELDYTKTSPPNEGLNGVLTGPSSNLSVHVHRYTASRMVSAGAPAVPRRFAGQPPWDITFLQYVPGEVTTAKLTSPVLTGPMSGCYLFRYVVSGETWIAHVGTYDLPTSQLSIKAKACWKDYAGSPRPSGIMGQSPLRFYSPFEVGAAKIGKLGGVPEIYGLFEPKGKFYSILLAPVGRDVEEIPEARSLRKLMKFCALKETYLESWEVIMKKDTFK